MFFASKLNDTDHGWASKVTCGEGGDTNGLAAHALKNIYP